MEITEQQFLKVSEFVQSKLDSLNWQHTLEIRPIAQKLAHLEKADKTIVDVAVLFHDLGKTKGNEGHADRSADMARKFLENEKFEQRLVEEVVYCIKVHSSPWHNESSLLSTPEAKVLFDADMIQQLSKFGIIKHILYFQEIFQNDFKEGLIKSRDTLFQAYNLIITENGRKLAEPGYKFVKDFFKDLI